MFKLFSKKKKKHYEVRSLFDVADFVDFMIISLTSGQTIPGSFTEARQALTHSEVLPYANRVIELYGMGSSFFDAVLDARAQCDHPYFLQVLDALEVSLKMGTNLSDSLDALGENLRRSGAGLVEEKAAKAPVKMLFPMVCFIFPAIFILLGAGVVRDLMQSLN